VFSDSDIYFTQAIYYLTLAANRGHMLALYNLAMMHLNGTKFTQLMLLN